jgi:hypothetical protein
MSQENQNTGAEAAPNVVTLPQRCRVNEMVILQLDVLFDFAPPKELKNDLLNVLLHYIMHEADNLPDDFKNVAQNYLMLFDWLETAEEEMHKMGFE